MNIEAAGSILTVLPGTTKKKEGIFSRSRTCKTQPLEDNDESNV